MSKQLIFIRKNHCYYNLLDHEEHEGTRRLKFDEF